MTTMVPARKVSNPNGITGRDPDRQDKLVHVPHNCPINIVKEMGSMVLVAVREKNTKAIVMLFVRYQIVWTWTVARESA